MKKTHQITQRDNKNAVGAIVAGITGTAVIAGVTVAGVMALKDEKSREKTKKLLIQAKDKAINFIDTFKTNSNLTDKMQTKKVTEDIKKK